MSSTGPTTPQETMPTTSTADESLNGKTLSVRPIPRVYTSSEGASSGTGTPIGFQRFPHNKILDHVAANGLRQPSPQPTHLAIPGSQHRVLSEEDPGYVAETFEGKQKQMEQGKPEAKRTAWTVTQY